jgi:hypothetical protein
MSDATSVQLVGISQADLRTRVEAEVLPMLPPGHTNGIVAHWNSTTKDLTIAGLQRVGDHVELLADIHKQPDVPWAAEFALVASW